jgi:hypothetical protein
MGTSTATYVPFFNLDTVPEKDRDRVAALIPDPRIAEGYVHRNIFGELDFDFFAGAMEVQKNVILTGPTGSAKTTVFRAFAAFYRLPFYRVQCSAAMDPAMVFGRTRIAHVDGLAVDEWSDGLLSLVVRYGGVVVFDEINMANARITAAYHGLLDVNRTLDLTEAGETIRAGHGGHEHTIDSDGVIECTGEVQPVFLAATQNPSREYEGTVRLGQAMFNRFAVPLDWDYDPAVEAELVVSQKLRNLSRNIRTHAEIRTPCSTNMLQEFEEHAAMWGMEAAIGLFVNHFTPDERGIVSRVLEAETDAIYNELAA